MSEDVDDRLHHHVVDTSDKQRAELGKHETVHYVLKASSVLGAPVRPHDRKRSL